jgi:hypothetical protein
VRSRRRVDVTFSTNVKLAAIQAGDELEPNEWGMRAAHGTLSGDVETEVKRAHDSGERA